MRCACLVDVLLVHLVGHQHNVLIMRKLDDVLQVVVRQALPSGVACRRVSVSSHILMTSHEPALTGSLSTI